jgi:hypothetical protein
MEQLISIIERAKIELSKITPLTSIQVSAKVMEILKEYNPEVKDEKNTHSP